MKPITFIFGLLLSTFANAKITDTPTFIEIKSDKSSYVTGDRAIFTTFIKTQPTDANDEVYVEAKLDGVGIKLTRISLEYAATVTSALVLGTHHYEVSAYLQDRNISESLKSTIAFYQDEIVQSQAALVTETDPVKIAQFQEIIARDQELTAIAQSQLVSNRRLVDVKFLDVEVVAPFHSPQLLSDDVILIESDHSGATYQVGESAVFTTHVLTDFEGTDGPQELVVRSQLDTTVLGVSSINPHDFTSTSSVFVTSNIGSHEFKSKLLIRSKARSDSTRYGIAQANSSRAAYVILRDQATDPLKQALYQAEINDLDLIINEFYAQLEASLALVQEKSFFINVIQ